jgi:2-polyprenyl-3-methyl-5-hydroxy-6-metoxy-1,4-benzoquinol methylase
MRNEQTDFATVNLADPRQDVHRERMHDPNLNRYRVAEGLLPAETAGLKVLELGGGIAELSRRMTEKGIKVTFVDLSDANLAKAAKLGLETHKLDLNLGLPPFEDSTFDGVVMLEIIEHVVAAEFLLKEIHRVLKPGGFVILSTPNFAFPLNRLRILAGGLSMDEGYHYRFFTVRSLAAMLRAAGLEVETTAHTVPAIGYNIIRNRLLGKPRLHVHVPNPIAPVFAHTLFFKARKGR